MRIPFLPAQFLQGFADKTAMPNDPHIVFRQPLGEIIFAAIINAVRDERGEFPGRVHRHHDHLGILPKRGRIFGQSEKPLHDYGFGQVRFKTKARRFGIEYPLSGDRACCSIAAAQMQTVIPAPEIRRAKRRFDSLACPGRAGGRSLRLGPITSGLPYIDYVDEGHILHPAIGILKSKSFDSSVYTYPPLTSYLIVAAIKAYAPFYRIFHHHKLREDLPADQDFHTNLGDHYDLITPPEIIWLGRLVVACLSVGTVHPGGSAGEAPRRSARRVAGDAVHRAVSGPGQSRIEPCSRSRPRLFSSWRRFIFASDCASPPLEQPGDVAERRLRRRCGWSGVCGEVHRRRCFCGGARHHRDASARREIQSRF